MKKSIIAVITITLILSTFPAVSHAADYTLSDGDSMTLSSGDTITIEPGASVTLSSGLTTLTNVRIICGAGVHLSLTYAKIDNSAYPGACPLTFTGEGNALYASGGVSLTGGAGVPGVSVAESAELTMDNCGLTAVGGVGAAGIGGAAGQDGGTVIFHSGTLIATGGSGGAGIGGGSGGAGGTLKVLRQTWYVSGTTVTATGTDGGAGIGGGAGGAGGSFETAGVCTVTASGGDGAGIGGGSSGNGGTVNITGGTVTASGNTGAGIGGGTGNAGGTVTISGGIVTVSSSSGAGIGGGGGSTTSGSGGNVAINGGLVNASSTSGADIGGGYNSGTAAINGMGGTLSLDNAGGLVLKNNGTNAAVTRGTCGITGAAAGSLSGVYFDGVPYLTGEVIDVSSTGSSTGYTYSSPVFTINANGEYLIWNATTANQIVVASGVEAHIILFEANIQPSSGYAFDMTGATVDMTLMGNSTLKSGKGYTCVLCPLGSTLTISGSGSLDAVAINNSSGGSGSGIGGNASTACGSITINSGTVTAAGGNTRGASFGLSGIGGAVVNISGGTVHAFSYKGGYALGGNSNTGSSITINGGTVTATAGLNNYGIGGKGSGSPDITISGGVVTAAGDLQSPGIGGIGGTLTISGGIVYTSNRNSGPAIALYSGDTVISGGTVYAASSDPAKYKDIGTSTGFEGTLTISGTANVFLKNNSCDTPITVTHENETFAAGTTEVYGEAVSVPDDWTGGFGAYLRPCTLSYHVNGGSGTAPEVTRLYGATVTLPDDSGMSKTGCVFGGWNTAADGSGTGYDAGESLTLTADTELFAQWTQLTLESTAPGGSTTNATVYTGGRFTLTPNVEGGKWDWDEAYFSATFNSRATFTALKAGASTITYTVGGVTASYKVTIEKSELPETGQNSGWIWVLGISSVLACTAAIALKKRSLKQY